MAIERFARFDNILAMETDAGKHIAFHARNMQVAEISMSAWRTLLAESAATASHGMPLNFDLAPEQSEELAELRLWNQEIDLGATDSDVAILPRSILVNIAQICNLKCDYCAAGGDGTFGEAMKNVELEKIYEQIRALVNDLPSGESLNLTFFGGEPLTAPEALRSLARFVTLQTAGRGLRVNFRIVTNGTLITPAIAELLASLRMHVSISIDAPPEINDRTRKTASGRGSTAMTLKGLGELMKVRSRLGSLTAGAVFGKHHTGVLETYRFLREFDFDMIKVDFAAEDCDEDDSRAYARELAMTADFAYASGGEKELRKIHLFAGYFNALDEQRRLNNHCGAGKSHFTIDGKGRMAACQWFIGRPNDQLNQGIDRAGEAMEPTALIEERMALYSRRQVDSHDCGSCWARHLCGGGCMYVNEVKTGSKQKKDKAFCDRTRNTIAKAIEIYAETRKHEQ